MSNQESKISACSGFSALPFGGGTRCTMASRTSSTPMPLFALIISASCAGMARTFSICSFPKCAGHFEQAIGKRGFAVIDVRDDTKIADELWVHLPYDRQGLSSCDVRRSAVDAV